MNDQAHNDYLQKYVDPVLEKLVVELLMKKPTEDLIDFMVNWLQSKGNEICKENQSKVENFNAYGDVSDEYSEEDEDEVEMLVPLPKKNANGQPKMRQSVSAEAYGAFNQKGNFSARVIAKSADAEKRILARMEQAFMFSGLDEKETKTVVDSFEEKHFKAGDNVITQGEDGDVLYVIDEGQLDCFKTFVPEDGPKHLKVYQPGEAFGELALLYNAPRAATITAKTNCILFALDRDCFNHIVKDAAAKKREKYENLLQQIEILQTVDPYERTQIADALKTSRYKAGEYVVHQGDQGNTFFFVQEGTAVATKVINEGEEAQEVFNYKTGDYFGELALLRDAPRAANIIAKTELTCCYLDRQSFKRLLGPLEDLLQRNFSQYQKFVF